MLFEPVAIVLSLSENQWRFLIHFRGHRVIVWVILYLFEHTGKDFQPEILLFA